MGGENHWIVAGTSGKKIVARLQFGDAEISVFVGDCLGPPIPYLSAVLQVLGKEFDGESLNRFTILLADSPIDDPFGYQLENDSRSIGAGGCRMLAAAMRVEIIFGEETGLSHHDGALALGKARELTFSIRHRDH